MLGYRLEGVLNKPSLMNKYNDWLLGSIKPIMRSSDVISEITRKAKLQLVKGKKTIK